MACPTVGQGYALSVAQGESVYINMTVPDPTGALVDISNARIYFSVRHRIEDTAPTIYKRSSLVTGGSTAEIEILGLGRYQIKLVPADTRTLRYDKRYFWDTWIVLPSGETNALVKMALFEVTPAITRFAV